MLNLMSIDFFAPFWNIIIFVFFRLIFSFHLSQYKESAFKLKQFCNPVFDLDRITKSSAYKSEFIFSPFGRTKFILQKSNRAMSQNKHATHMT